MSARRARRAAAPAQRSSRLRSRARSTVTSVGDARAHTLARHRDILQEFTQEHRRVRNNLNASREHAALLGARGNASSDGLAPLTGCVGRQGCAEKMDR